MSRKLLFDYIVVIDVEATCWKEEAPGDEVSEIIEVGVSLLDLKTLKAKPGREIFVRPQRSKVSEFCTQLTTIKPEMVARAPVFPKVCETLRTDFKSHRRLWASYGGFDLKQFRVQCERDDAVYPFSDRHLNVKTMTALALGMETGRPVGMAEALERLGFELKGTHHRGADDAHNIARLLGMLIRRLRSPAGSD